MTTAQSLIDATRKTLLGGLVEERNFLSAPYVANSGTLSFTAPAGGIKAGAMLSIGLNSIYVISVSGTTATVQAGQDGSTDANAASGATVRVRPRFPDFDILTALNDDLRALSSPINGLFRMRTVDITATGNTVGYDLTGVTDLIDVHSVRYAMTGSFGMTPRIHRTSWRLERNNDVSEYPSGLRLEIYAGGQPGQPITVQYRAPFGTLSTAADVVETVTGLPSTAVDLPPMGAALRLMAGREIKRSFTEAQGDTRRADEVAAGAAQASFSYLRKQRQDRIVDEASRLQAQYGVMGP